MSLAEARTARAAISDLIELRSVWESVLYQGLNNGGVHRYAAHVYKVYSLLDTINIH